MKDYDVIGYDVDGARYCVGCWLDILHVRIPRGERSPVFAGDEEPGNCENCHEPLLEA